MTVRRTGATSRERPGAGLWFGLLGGAGAWAVQFLSGYLITESMCVAAARAGADVAAGGVLTGPLVVVLVISLITFAVAVAAALDGRRVWLGARDGEGESMGGTAWTGLAGMLLSGVFAFIIAAQVLPAFMAGGCT